MGFQVGTKGSIGVQVGRSVLSADEALERADELRANGPAEVIFTDAVTGQPVIEAEVKRLAKKGPTRP